MKREIALDTHKMKDGDFKTAYAQASRARVLLGVFVEGIISKMIIMADVHDRQTRSFNMSMIKGKNTKPELLVRKFLFKNGYRYRLNYAKLPGKPDIVLPKHQTVIFINGCFWHGHEGCKYYVLPKTRRDWWLKKITKTKKHDKFNSDKLRELGWSVQIIWECELKPISFEKTLNQLLEELQDKVL